MINLQIGNSTKYINRYIIGIINNHNDFICIHNFLPKLLKISKKELLIIVKDCNGKIDIMNNFTFIKKQDALDFLNIINKNLR